MKITDSTTERCGTELELSKYTVFEIKIKICEMQYGKIVIMDSLIKLKCIQENQKTRKEMNNQKKYRWKRYMRRNSTEIEKASEEENNEAETKKWIGKKYYMR